MKTQLVFTLIVSLFETAFYGGAVWGWAAIQPVLINEGYFSTGCNSTLDSANLCQSQTERLNLVYTIATASAPILTLLNGVLQDKRGVWVARTAMIILVSIGNLLNAISSSEFSWLLFISFPLTNIGGYGLTNINLSLSYLYPKIKATVVALVTGSFDSGVVVYLLMSWLYGMGASFKALFIFTTCLCVIFHISTFTLTPRYSAPNKLPPNYVYGYKELACFHGTPAVTTNTLEKDNLKNQSDPAQEISESVEKLSYYLKKRYTWTNYAHFCIMNFCLTFFIGSFNNWIVDKVGSDDGDEVDRFITIFVITQCLAVLIAPFSGLVNDLIRQRLLKSLSLKLANMKAVSLTLIIGDVLIIFMFVFSLIPSKELQYVTMMLQVIGRSFMYATSASFISVGYPSRHLGVLNSLMECLGGIFLLLQFPVTLIVTRLLNNDYQYIYVFLLAMCVIALFHPLGLLLYVKRSASANKRPDGETFSNSAFEATAM